MVLMMLCIAFTSINLNVVQARKMYSDIKAQIQASNGYYVDDATGLSFDSTLATGDDKRTLAGNGYQYKYTVIRQQLSSAKQDDNETWIYNDIYKISFRYTYTVPLFGKQTYPIVGYTY
jgi:hypothetical protein